MAREFHEIASMLRQSAEALCKELLPGGSRRGHEWVCGDLNGGRGESLAVNLKEGVWKDFASGEAGADLINLIAARHNIGQGEAAQWAERWLGLDVNDRPASKRRPDVQIADRGIDPQAGFAPEPDEDEWRPAGSDPFWYRREMPTHQWHYVTIDGEHIATVFRFKHPVTGEKCIRPWDVKAGIWQAPKLPAGEKRPPLYLKEIVQSRASQPVVITEGEKACDAVRAIGWLATTNMGGAQAVGLTDWSPLAGRHVVIWRDKDRGGRQQLDRLLDLLRTVEPASVRLVELPLDKPVGWDAADASEDERRALLEAAGKVRPVISGKPRLCLADWHAPERYAGPAPEQRMLVEGVFPLGAPCMLAGMGDIGKGMLLLDLAAKVAGDPSLIIRPTAFGGTVCSFGAAVVLAGEDDMENLHRRLERLSGDQDINRFVGKLFLIPLPNAGGNYPLIRSGPRGAELTEHFDRLRDELAAIKDLRLVILDPLARFAAAALEKETDAGQILLGALGALAAELGCTVLLSHHMRKGRGKEERIVDAAGAREAIRGGTGLVDGVRAVYALWPEYSRPDAMSVLRELQIDVEGDDWRGKVVSGAVVKSNGIADKSVRTFVRDGTGLLIDRTSDLAVLTVAEKLAVKKLGGKTEAEEPATNLPAIEILVGHIRLAARAGAPYHHTGPSNGVFAHKETLPAPLNRYSKVKLEREVAKALDAGLLVKTKGGGRRDVWLDAPDGPFAKDSSHTPTSDNRVEALRIQRKKEEKERLQREKEEAE